MIVAFDRAAPVVPPRDRPARAAGYRELAARSPAPRHLRLVLADEVRRGRVVHELGAYRLAVDFPSELRQALAGIYVDVFARVNS